MPTNVTADTRQAFERLRRLSAALDGISVDWQRFAQLAEQSGPAPDRAGQIDALAAVLVGAGLQRADTQRAVGLLLALPAAEAAIASASPQAFAALLRDLAADGDVEGLALALTLSPHDGHAYIARLRELVAAADPAQPADVTAARAELARILMACPKPGRVIGPVTAEAILDGIEAWRRLTTETPEQRAIREAFAHARALMDQHGQDDPRTMDAVIKALELQDPGCCARMLAQGGVTMPAPTHCTADGAPLYSLEAVADALGADVAELKAIAEDMDAVELDMRSTVAGRLH
ncbi:MAG: hypothetical protein RL489_575 [Pseudomonadota bacterium]|jgi:hypothetical protein